MRLVSPTNTSITVARRVSGFSYAIRNIVVEAQRVEASGKKVRYLNVGNPPAFGFDPPAHMIAAVERAMQQCLARGARRAIRLSVSAPFHCALMKPAADVMEEALAATTILIAPFRTLVKLATG